MYGIEMQSVKMAEKYYKRKKWTESVESAKQTDLKISSCMAM